MALQEKKTLKLSIDEKEWHAIFDKYRKHRTFTNHDITQPLDYLYSLLITLEVQTDDVKTKGYYGKLIDELNKVVNVCVPSILKSKLQPKQYEQLIAILQSLDKESYDNKIDEYVDSVANNIAFLFKTPNKSFKLIKFVDDPNFGKSTEAKVSGLKLDTIQEVSTYLSMVPRGILLKISRMIDSIDNPFLPETNDNNIFDVSSSIEDLLEYLKDYQSITQDNLSQFPDLFDLLQKLINKSSSSGTAGNEIIHLIEGCIIDKFLSKLFDDELQKIHHGFILGINRDN